MRVLGSSPTRAREEPLDLIGDVSSAETFGSHLDPGSILFPQRL